MSRFNSKHLKDLHAEVKENQTSFISDKIVLNLNMADKLRFVKQNIT